MTSSLWKWIRTTFWDDVSAGGRVALQKRPRLVSEMVAPSNIFDNSKNMMNLCRRHQNHFLMQQLCDYKVMILRAAVFLNGPANKYTVKGFRLFCQETTTFTPQVLVCRFAAKNDSLLVVVMCFVNGRSVMFVCWTNVLTVYISLSVGLCLSLSVHACLSQPTRCIFTCLSVRVSWCICLCLSQCICP